jgi:uncharacterized protein (DUF3084 family)
MFQFAWSTPVRKTMTSLTLAFSFIIGLSGVIRGWSDIDPFLPAHRGYVIQRVQAVDKDIKPVINQLLLGDMQRELRRLDRDQAEADKEKAQWLIKQPTEPDADTRNMIQKRINQIDLDKAKLEADKAKVQAQIKKLQP